MEQLSLPYCGTRFARASMSIEETINFTSTNTLQRAFRNCVVISRGINLYLKKRDKLEYIKFHTSSVASERGRLDI